MLQNTFEDFLVKAIKVHKDRYTYPANQEDVRSKSKIRVICREHGEFLQTVSNHLSGKGCAKCGDKVKNRNSLEDIQAKILLVHQDNFEYDFSSYKTTKEKIQIKCKRHDTTFQQSVEVHLRGSSGCPECTKEKFSKTNLEKHSAIFFGTMAEKFPTLDFSESIYTTAQSHVQFKCPRHGECRATPDTLFRSKHGCLKCSLEDGTPNKTPEKFLEEVTERHGDRFNYSETVYTGFDKKIRVTCKKCDRSFDAVAIKHLQRGSCPYCYESTLEAVCRAYLEKNKIEFETQKTFDSCRHVTKLKFDVFIPDKKLLIELDGQQHFEAKSIFGGEKGFQETQIRDAVKNHWANENRYTLLRIRFDQDVEDILESEIRPVYHSIRKELSQLLDKGSVTDFEKGDLLVDIIGFDQEYSEDYLTSREKLFQTQGKKYIPLFQSEWLKKEIVLSRLNNWLGLSNKIHARQTSVREVSTREAGNFLEENHLQGRIGGSVKLGLYYNNELVQIAVFGGLRLNLGQKAVAGKYELLRLCSKKSFSVTGGASKLFKAFLKLNPVEVISYCDLRWGTGKLYENLGFSKIHRTKPNYFYTDGENLFNRFKFRKDKLISNGQAANKTEKQIMLELGYNRIYDLGHYLYTYRAKETNGSNP